MIEESKISKKSQRVESKVFGNDTALNETSKFSQKVKN